MDYMTRQNAVKDFCYQIENEPEMDEFDSAFICSLLEEFKPKKIVEIGVAAGGTTGIVLKKLETRSDDIQMYSCDISKRYYRGKEIDGSIPETGFLAAKIREDSRVHHRFILGEYYPAVANSIGTDIDFVILDTVHSLPGELLDLLAIMPFLAERAVVVLHDISYHLFDYRKQNAFATCAIFNSVVADKIFAFSDNDLQSHSRIPNIAAFQMNELTQAYIQNLFGLFMLPWRYMPSDAELNVYRDHYLEHYGQDMVRFFDESIISQKWLFSQKANRDKKMATRIGRRAKRLLRID